MSTTTTPQQAAEQAQLAAAVTDAAAWHQIALACLQETERTGTPEQRAQALADYRNSYARLRHAFADLDASEF